MAQYNRGVAAKKKSAKRASSKKTQRPRARGKASSGTAAPLDPVAAALARRRLALIRAD
jgi:hypothetical protein